jgi:hypothetical protein
MGFFVAGHSFTPRSLTRSLIGGGVIPTGPMVLSVINQQKGCFGRVF